MELQQEEKEGEEEMEKVVGQGAEPREGWEGRKAARVDESHAVDSCSESESDDECLYDTLYYHAPSVPLRAGPSGQIITCRGRHTLSSYVKRCSVCPLKQQPFCVPGLRYWVCESCANGEGSPANAGDLHERRGWRDWRILNRRRGGKDPDGGRPDTGGAGFLEVNQWHRFDNVSRSCHVERLQNASRSRLQILKRWFLPKSMRALVGFICFTLLHIHSGFGSYASKAVVSDPRPGARRDVLPLPLLPLNPRSRPGHGWGSEWRQMSREEACCFNLTILGLNYLGAHSGKRRTPSLPHSPSEIQFGALNHVRSCCDLCWGNLIGARGEVGRSSYAYLSKLRTENGYEEVVDGVEKFVGSRIDLPSVSGAVGLLENLPWNLRAFFSREDHVANYNRSQGSRRKFFTASPGEWSRFIFRGIKNGLLGVFRFAKSVCGAFVVLKSDLVALRFIFDGRPTNAKHGEALPCTVCSPSGLSDLELSPVGVLFLTKAGIRSFFFNIRSAEWMHAWHCLPGIDLDVLKSEAAKEGLEIFVDEGRGHLSQDGKVYPYFKVLPMGYVHSQFLAQTVHETVLFKHTTLRRTHQIVDNEPSLRRALEVRFGIVCDGLFAFAHTRELALKVDAELNLAYATVGLERYEGKGLMGELRGEVLGCEFVGTRGFHPPGAKGLRLVRASLEAVHRRCLSPWVCSKIWGNWLWWGLLNRPCLSLLNETFGFAVGTSKTPMVIPMGVREELILCVVLFAMFEANIGLKWDLSLTCTDASEEGFGGCRCDAIEEEVRLLGEYSERKFDYVLWDGWEGSPGQVGEDKNLAGHPHLIDLRGRCLQTHLAGVWKHSGHINELELEAVLLHLKA